MNNHRKPRPAKSVLGQRAVRIGLFAAGIAGVAATVPAQAASAATGGGRHAAFAADDVFSHANRKHHTQARDSFSVRQFGAADAVGVRNQADAVSAGCSADDACRSVALSFQIVTFAGEHTHLNAVNLSDATNKSCTGCQTLAGAYQFIVSTPKPVNLDRDVQRQLGDVHRKLDELTRSGLPAADLKRQADGLAAEVTGILRDAVAHAPKGTEQPEVTLHRHLDGWPGH
ncbi:hypothetical protein [Streptomyces sp. NPDC005423]|uniref:hypothetical protein n=1 Tax=Streptomyces sp. NPDC005423 TaxID=3155343 RepID=UPI0033AD36BB